MKNFKELRIWQKGIEIAVKSYKATSTFPGHEKFGIISQINRAGVSIPSNIAEGSSRSSSKDYARFVEISLGSSFELETHLIISRQLNFGEEEEINNLLFEVGEEQKMLQGFLAKLNK